MSQVLSNDAIIKAQFEDFYVNEISYVPQLSKNGNYHYLRLTKKGYTTFQAIDNLAKFLNISSSLINTEGLKDEDGITSQILSVNYPINKNLTHKINNHLKTTLPKDTLISVELVGHGKSPVKEQYLHGNQFLITLRNLEPKLAEEIYHYCKSNRNISFLNYYDYQRFGLPEGPFITHLLGKAILNRQWTKAIQIFHKTGNHKIENGGMIREVTDGKKFFKSLDHRKINFFLSSHHSYTWNLALDKMIPKKGSTMLKIFNGFNVKIPLISIALPDRINILVKTLNENFELFEEVKTRNTYITTTIFAESPEDDILYNKKRSIQLNFFLPSGSYATMIIKQLLLKVTINYSAVNCGVFPLRRTSLFTASLIPAVELRGIREV